MKLEFDNDWINPETNDSGKNKILYDSAKLLTSAIARKVKNPIHSSLRENIIYRNTLSAYFRCDKKLRVNNLGDTTGSNRFVATWINLTREDSYLFRNILFLSFNDGFFKFIEDPKRNISFIRCPDLGSLRGLGVGPDLANNDFTLIFIYRPNDFSNRILLENEGLGYTLKQTSETTLELTGFPVITHNPFSTKDFHILTLVRKSGESLRRRLDGVEDGIVDDASTPLLSFNEYFDSCNMDLMGFIQFIEAVPNNDLVAIESLLENELIKKGYKYNGIQYHAIGTGDPNWTDQQYASGTSLSTSGLTNEYQREIPYYCKFVENYVGKAQAGSLDSVIDSRLQNYTRTDLLSRLLYVGSGTNAGYSGIITSVAKTTLNTSHLFNKIIIDPNEKGFDKVFVQPDFPSQIDDTSVYEIRDIAVSGIKVTNKIRIRTRFKNNIVSGTNVTIREHGLFGSYANSEKNTGLIFNHVMLSGTQQIDYTLDSTKEFEFLMRLQGE